MVKALKIEIFVLCMIVLIGLAVRSRRSLFSSTQQLLFSMLGYTSAAYILFDMIWTLSDGADGTLGIAANWISNAVSFSLFAVACLIWFIYSETVQGSRLLTSRYRVVLVALPTALVVVLAFTSYWTHALFYIDSQGVYRRGFAYMIQPIVSYCYVIHTSLHAFVQSRRVESLQTKAIYRTLAFFAIPALVGGTFQVVYSVPGLCVGIMISMLLLYIIYQEQLISTDPLTGLNNRNRFETYMLSLFSNVDQAEDVYLLMMDADGFKQINDRYGHVEGDHALQVISAALKEVCSASGGFIARYGGDEFVVLQKAARNRISCICARQSTTSSRMPRCRMHCGCPSVARGSAIVLIPGKTYFALPMRSSTASRPRKRKPASRYARKRVARLRAWRPSAHRCIPLS